MTFHCLSPVVDRTTLSGAVYAPNESADLWLNPNAFAATNAYGNSGRNRFRGPGLWQTDLGLSNRFPVTEGVNLEFRAEAFNLFNRAHYGNPVNTRQSGTFGRILVAANDGATGAGSSRRWQCMLRLNF